MKKILPVLAALLGFLALPSVSHAQSGLTIQQSTTSRKIVFLLVQSADHVTPLTGATATVTLSKNGAAFASPAGSVAELANGWYVLTPTSADTGTLGVLIVHATATSGDPADIVANIVAFNPDSATNLGLSNLSADTGTLATASAQTSNTTTLGTINTNTAATNTQTSASSQQANVVAGLTTQGYSSARAALLPNLDATVSSRGTSTYAGTDTSGTTTLLSRLSSTRATGLDFLDATISSRSTYAGADTSGITTLLSRLSSTRAGYLDNLLLVDVATSTRLATSGYTAPPAAPTVPTASENAVAVWASGTRSLTDKVGFSLSQAFPSNFSLLSINGSGAITTSNPATGGSSLSITDVQTALTNQGVTATRAGYLDNIATAAPTSSAISAVVKAGTAPSWYIDPPSASTIAAAVAGIVVDNTGSSPLTMKQVQALMGAALSGKYTVGALNTTSHTQVTTYYRADAATVICTSTVTYATNNTTVTGRTTVWANLP